MNAKNARALRRLARQHSLGMPERAIYERNPARPLQVKNGEPLRPPGTQVNSRHSTRGVYRGLKRGDAHIEAGE